MKPQPLRRLLILGNGLSRIPFDEAIRQFPGEVWGCNRVFVDYGEVLTGLAGHVDVMLDARKMREERGFSYKIMGSENHEHVDDLLQAPKEFWSDTGTTLVAEGIVRGYQVECVGFDLGGPDVYSPGHHRLNKTMWVKRWRRLNEKLGLDRVTFWGHDHKPFIQSDQHPAEYARKYLARRPHITGDEYAGLAAIWTDEHCIKSQGDYNMVTVGNIGKRTWRNFHGLFWISKERKRVPEGLALMITRRYPLDFQIQEDE